MATAHKYQGPRRFFGLTSYYRKFVPNYRVIAAPLTAMLKKNAFQRAEEAIDSFHKMKQAMSKPPILALPNFSVIKWDAFGKGIGVVLIPEGRPILYLSQALKGRTLGLSTNEKKLLVLVISVQKWQPYLLGQQFIIHADQQSLKYLLEQRIRTPTQHKWLTKLLGYDFVVEYTKGRENKAADALSRVEWVAMAISKPRPIWVETVREEYN